MAIALGGGMNLGTASVFLFVDASGMRRGIQQAERDLQQLNKKVAAAVAANQKAMDASTAASTARGTQASLRSAAITGPIAVADRQLTNSLTAVRKAYDDRTKAMATFEKVQERQQEVIDRETRSLRQLENQIVSLQKKEASLQRDLARTPIHPDTGLGDPRYAAPGTKTSNRRENDLEETRQKLAQLGAEALETANRIAAAEARVDDAAQTMRRAVTGANTASANSMARLKGAIEAENQAYVDLARTAGPQYEAMANRIRSAGNRVITTTEALVQAQARLQRAQQARLANPTDTGAIAAVERETRAVTAAEIAQKNAVANREKTQRELTNAVDSEVDKREALYDEEVAAARRAAEEENQIRQQAARNAMQRGVEMAQQGFVAMAAGIGQATKQFVGFEQQMVAVSAISEDVDRNLGRFTERVQALAVEMGKSPEELAAAMYEISQAGFEGEQAFAILELGAKASIAGMTSVEDAVKPLIGVMNAYGLSTAEASDAMDVMFAGVTEGIFSFDELSQQIGDNLSLTSALGVSLEELMAVYVVLTRRSNSLAESTTQVNAIMNSFLKPSTALSEAVMELTGESAELYFQTNDLADVLALVEQMFIADAEAAGRLFPNIRAIRGVFGLTNEEGAQVADMMGTMEHATDGAGVTAQVFADQMESTAAKMRIVREQLRSAAISFGSAVAPSLVVLGNAVGFIAEKFANLPSPIRDAVGAAALIATGFLGLVVLFDRVAIAGSAAIEAVKGLATFMQSSARVGAILSFALNPVVLALGAVAAISFLVWQRQKDEAAAVENLAQKYNDLNEVIAERARSGELSEKQIAREAELNDLIAQGTVKTQEQTDAMSDAADMLTGMLMALSGSYDPNTTILDPFTGDELNIQQAKDRLAEYIAYEQEAADQAGDLARVHEYLGTILNDTAFDWEKHGQAVFNAFEQYAEGEILLPDLEKFLFNMISNIAMYREGWNEGAGVAEEVAQKQKILNDLFGDAESRLEAMREALISMGQSAITASGAMLDMTSPLAYLQSMMGRFDASVHAVLLTLSNVGDISLDEATEQALIAAERMYRWKQAVDETLVSIQEHNDAIGEWSNIQQTVADAVGTEENGFKALNDMFRMGKIGQQEYTSIREAALRINGMAVDAINEERVAVARMLPILDARLAEYRLTQDAYDNLTDDQKARVAALDEERTQTLLLTTVILKMAAAMGAIPAEAVTKFILDTTAADPAFAYIAEQMGLIDPLTQAEIDLRVSGDAIDTIAEIDAAIADIDAYVAGLERTGQATVEELERARIAKERLGAKKTDIIIGVDVDDAEARDTIIEDAELIGEELTEAGSEVEEAWDDAWASVGRSAETVKDMANREIPNLISEIRPGMDDPLAWLTEGWMDAEASIEKVILRLDEMNSMPLALTDWQRDALAATVALNKTEDALAEITDEIGGYSDAISEAQGYQSLLDEVLGDSRSTMERWNKTVATGKTTAKEYDQAIKNGAAHEAYANLNELVEKGYLTQAEANRVIEHAESIRRQSNRTILEEQAAIALSLPALDRYIKRHREAEDSYENLTEEQKGFVAALQDEANMQRITNVLMIAQLEMMGAVAEGTARRVADAYAKVSPAFAAIADDMGLLEGTKNLDAKAKVTVQNTAQEAVDAVTPADGVVIPAKVEVAEEPRVTPSPSASPTSTTQTVNVAIDLDGAEVQATESGRRVANGYIAAVKDVIKNGAVAVGRYAMVFVAERLGIVHPYAMDSGNTVGGEFTAAVERALINGGDTLATTATSYAAKLDDDVTTPNVAGKTTGGEYTAGVESGISKGKASTVAAAQLYLQALRLGQDAAAIGRGVGAAYAAGVAYAVEYAKNTLVAAVVSPTGIVTTLGAFKDDANGTGQELGDAFLDGVLLGLNDTGKRGLIRTSAAGVGREVYEGAANELEVESPSAKGEYIGQMFVEGVGRGVEAATPGMVETGRRMATQLNDAATSIEGMGDAPLWLVDIATQMRALAESNEALDPDKLRSWAESLSLFEGNAGIAEVADGLIRLANQTDAGVESVTVAASEYGSNLEWAADRIAEFKGDQTPQQFVNMSNELRRLAESSDQLDADKLRDYADQLRATGDAGLIDTANYLDAVASNVDERARRVMLQRQADLAEQQAQAKDDLTAAIEDATDDLPDILKRYANLSPETQRLAASYISARLRGDTAAATAEYQKLIPLLDNGTRDVLANAATELKRKGVPRGWLFTGGDIVRDMAMIEDLAREYLGEADAAAFLVEWNNRLADSYANVAASRGLVDLGGRRPTVGDIDAALADRFGADWEALSGAQRESMRQFLGNFVMGNREGAAQAWGELSSFMTAQGQQALYDLATSMRTTARATGQTTGAAVGRGMGEGMMEGSSALYAAGLTLGRSAERGIRDALQIASPSAVTAALGTNAAQSFHEAFIRASQSFRAMLARIGMVNGQLYAQEFQRAAALSGSSVNALVDATGRMAESAGRGVSAAAPPQPQGVTVNAPIDLGGISVSGAGDPQQIAVRVKDELFGALKQASRMMQASVEGAL